MPVIKLETKNDGEDYDSWTWFQCLYQLGILDLDLPGGGYEVNANAIRAIGESLSRRAEVHGQTRLEYLQAELVCLMDELEQYAPSRSGQQQLKVIDVESVSQDEYGHGDWVKVAMHVHDGAGRSLPKDQRIALDLTERQAHRLAEHLDRCLDRS